MATKAIRQFSGRQECKDNSFTSRSYQIVQYGHESAKSLIDAFRKVKGKRRGAATDEQQDILRAALVFSGGCIDSCLKQLIKECLPELIHKDEHVKKAFETFVERALRRADVEPGVNLGILARTLTSAQPLEYLSEAYVYDLTGSSLQSVEQLFSACKALGLDPVSQVKLCKKELDRVFKARNQVVHEMDIDFSAPRRNRFQRTIGDTIDMTNILLEISEQIIELVHEKLTH